MRNSGVRTLATVVVAGLVGVFGLSGVAGAAAAGPNQGVTSKSVKIGFIFSKTGVASSNFASTDAGCKARIGRENAKGGVNGRKIAVTYLDDQSSGQNLTGAQDLVQNKHVYMIVNDSSFAFLTWRWLLQNNVPTIGGGYDGTEYGQPGNQKLISAFGNQSQNLGVSYDTLVKIMKARGAKKVAALGYGISPSSSTAARTTTEIAAPSVGLKGVYTNTSVDFGSTDVSPLVLGIKNSGADAAYYAMVANTNLAIAQGLQQNGVKMKAQIMATGYGQQLLAQPIAKQIGSDVIMTSIWAPVELKTKATQQFQSDLKKYAGFTAIPDYGVYTGYIDCDLAVLALKAQGKTLDPTTFSDTVRKLGHFNAGGGLGCQETDISLAGYGKPAQANCTYAVSVKSGKFVVVKPKGSKQPFWTGKLIGSSVSGTTTTAAP